MENERYALDKRVAQLENELDDTKTELQATKRDARHWRDQASDATERRHKESMAHREKMLNRFNCPRVVVRDKDGCMTHVRNPEDGEVIGNA
jgi:hypothetical protein